MLYYKCHLLVISLKCFWTLWTLPDYIYIGWGWNIYYHTIIIIITVVVIHFIFLFLIYVDIEVHRAIENVTWKYRFHPNEIPHLYYLLNRRLMVKQKYWIDHLAQHWWKLMPLCQKLLPLIFPSAITGWTFQTCLATGFFTIVAVALLSPVPSYRYTAYTSMLLLSLLLFYFFY